MVLVKYDDSQGRFVLINAEIKTPVFKITEKLITGVLFWGLAIIYIVCIGIGVIKKWLN